MSDNRIKYRRYDREVDLPAHGTEDGDYYFVRDTSTWWVFDAVANILKKIGGAVTSVFGRTGAVTAQNGDYSVGQITGAAPLASPALTGSPTVTGASSDTLTEQNTTAATGSVAQSSPSLVLAGKYWDGAASQTDKWTIQDVVGNGTNGKSQLTFTHSGSTGNAQILGPSGASANPGYGFSARPASGMYFSGGVTVTYDGSGCAIVIGASGGNHVQVQNGQGYWSFFGKLLEFQSDNTLAWSSTTVSNGTADIGLSRSAAGVVAVGNGTAGDFTGSLKYNNGSLVNAMAATNTTSQSSPTETFSGQYWNGTASAEDKWTIQNVVANGTNPISALTILHSGSSGQAQILLPGGNATTPGIAFSDFPTNGMSSNGSNSIQFSIGSVNKLQVNNTGLAITNIITNYNGEVTAGAGVPYTRGSTSQKAETGADASLLSVTPAAAAGTYRVKIVMSCSAASAATLGWTVTYKDSNGQAQSPANLALNSLGVAAPALTFSAAANGVYFGEAYIDVDNSATAIIVKTTFSGTSIAYKATATIERVI